MFGMPAKNAFKKTPKNTRQSFGAAGGISTDRIFKRRPKKRGNKSDDALASRAQAQRIFDDWPAMGPTSATRVLELVSATFRPLRRR